jgi:hypothetical protein
MALPFLFFLKFYEAMISGLFGLQNGQDSHSMNKCWRSGRFPKWHAIYHFFIYGNKPPKILFIYLLIPLFRFIMR